MKIFVQLFSLFLVIAGVILLVLSVDRFPAFYDVRYMGTASLLGVLFIHVLPWLLRVRANASDAVLKNGAVDKLQFLLALFIACNTAGELGLFAFRPYGFAYDKFLHTLIPLASTLAVPSFLESRFGVGRKRAIMFVFFGIILIGVLWEVYEYVVDLVWNSHLFGSFGRHKFRDTTFDIIFNIAGTALGTILVSYRQMRLTKIKE